MLVALVAAGPAQAALTLTDVGSFTRPMYVTAPPGDGQRLMVVLRDGEVRVVKDGATLPQPFLTIPDVDSDPGTEGGLMSMAFPPDYAASGRFYVYMAVDDANPGQAPHGPIEIREYRRSAANPDIADPATRRTVLSIPHPDEPGHYGGGLQFGPDGLLYASIGDGGGEGDPQDNAKNKSSRLGKLLRLDPRPLGLAPYRVPATNPFAGGGGDPLVYSYGLRNPFRFSFDRDTGDLTIGDVGQNVVEEIDFVPSAQGRGLGANFGWDSCEGNQAYPNVGDPCTFDHTEPVHTYPNPVGDCSSVTGGVVVRDPGLEELEGKYLYGDFCRTYVKTLNLALPTATDETTLSVSVPAFQLVAFGEDACGRVHLALLAESGKVQRLEDETPSGCDRRVSYPPPSVPPASPPASPSSPAIPAAGLDFDFVVGGIQRQRALRKGYVSVRVRCNAACRARALGGLSLKLKGKQIGLRQARGRRRSAGVLTLKLRVPARARRPLRRALRARRRVRAGLIVRVRDGAGRLSLRGRSVRLVR